LAKIKSKNFGMVNVENNKLKSIPKFEAPEMFDFFAQGNLISSLE
jgi:hypothetical protein